MNVRTSPRQDQLYPLYAMLLQRDTIARALMSKEPWRALVSRFPSLLEVLSHGDLSGQPPLFGDLELLELYRRYCEEWDRVPLAPALARLAA